MIWHLLRLENMNPPTNNKRRVLPRVWPGVSADAHPQIEELPLHCWDHSLLDSKTIQLHFACYPNPKIRDPKNLVSKVYNVDLFGLQSALSPFNDIFTPEYKLTLNGLFNKILQHSKPYANSFDPKKQMSVGIILRYPESLGGGNFQILQYAKFLRSKGVFVNFYGGIDFVPKWIVDSGFPFHSGKFRQQVFSNIQDPVVIIPSILDVTALQFLAPREDRRIIHLCQGIETFHFGRDPGELLAEKTYFDLLHSIPVGRIVNSHQIEAYFNHRFQQDCWYVPNSINEIFLTAKHTARVPYNKNRPFNILWVGDTRSVLKGFDTFKKTVKQLVQELKIDISVAIISPNEIPASEYPYIDGVNTAVYCKVDNHQMLDFYRSADVLLSTSIYEGLGMPIIEALTCMTPVVMTDNGGISGIVEHDKHLFIAPVGDYNGFVSAIRSIIEKPEESIERTKRGRDLALQYTNANQEKYLTEVFSEILDRDLSSPATSGITSNKSIFNQQATLSDKPKFSVLMPTFNQAHYVAESIQSVQNQTLKNWELVICDDGSTDNTPEVIKPFLEKDPRIKYVRKENGGTGSALNRALKESKGEWITWLSSDDLYEPYALETFEAGIGNNPNCKFFHAHYYMLNDLAGRKDAPEFQPASVQTPPEDQVLTLLRGNHVNGITICIHKSALNDIGYFNEGNRNGQDYEMWLRLSLKYPWTFLKTRVASTRLHQDVVQVAFPEAGVYDSAAGAQLVINENTFEKFFPLLDLNKPEHAWKALLGSLQLSLFPDAFIYQGMGYHTSFLERAIEWISSPQGQRVYGIIKDPLIQLVEPLRDTTVPTEIFNAMNILASGGKPNFKFTPTDPYKLAHKHLQSLRNSNETSAADKVEKFLKKVKRFQPELLAPPIFHTPTPGISRPLQ